MSNIDFLRDVVETRHEYWIVAKESSYSHFSSHRGDDSIWLISIPRDVPREDDFYELKVKDVERIKRVSVEANIALGEDYPPFQLGQSMSDYYSGYPLDKINPRNFLKRALDMKSHDLWEYRELWAEMVKELEADDAVSTAANPPAEATADTSGTLKEES